MAAVAAGFSPASIAAFGLLCERFQSDEQYITIRIELVVGLLGQTGLSTNGASGAIRFYPNCTILRLQFSLKPSA